MIGGENQDGRVGLPGFNVVQRTVGGQEIQSALGWLSASPYSVVQ